MENSPIKRIIWLENDIKFIDTTESFFKEFGYSIIRCTSVAQAMASINRGDSDSLLLDVDFENSPKEGLIFLQELRRTHPHIKVVIFTAYFNLEDKSFLLSDPNTFDYIEKPIPTSRSELHEFFSKIDRAFKDSMPTPTATATATPAPPHSVPSSLSNFITNWVTIFGGILMLAGIVFIIMGYTGDVKLKLAGQELATPSIGIAVLFIGAAIIIVMYRQIINKSGQ